MTNADIPAYVKVESIGTAEGEAPRTMETYAALTPIYTGFGAAIMTASPTSFNNNFQVNGQSGNDGDVYVLNGDLTITSSPVIYGNVYVPNGQRLHVQQQRDQGRSVGQRDGHDQQSLEGQ